MGVNNRQRRKLKQRKRDQQHGRGPTRPRAHADGWSGGAAHDHAEVIRDLVDLRIGTSIRAMMGSKPPSGADASRHVESIMSLLSAPLPMVEQAVTGALRHLHAAVIDGGWAAADVEELVRRRVGADALGTLVAAAGGDAREVRGPAGAATGLRVAVALAMAPLAEPGTARTQAPSPARSAVSEESARKLATVRGLLAKAERTSFDEEADALSAKAQELISRYALERLLAEGAADAASPSGPTTRRIWLDAPYLMAKASLVDAVATANRCRCLVGESLGLCSVLGDPADLDAVALLSTSLLVQANRSMLRHGRNLDHRGRSRTRSFRQSFLISFATRIGERLRQVDDRTMGKAGPGTDLVPVLRERQERLDRAFAEMFPHVVATGTRISNGAGWAAGHAAADLAQLDLLDHLTETAAPPAADGGRAGAGPAPD